ncbi:MAG: hypothetical protein HYU79_03275 [Nitrosomonadales bacterium]|nr:hypothetical protein [Nitrosomonadales bacterium]
MKTLIALLALAAIANTAVAAPQPNADTAKPAVALPPGHMPIGTAQVDLGDIKVPKAIGPNARTVAEVITKRVELKDKTVLVRGKVVKFTPEILNKNWIHLRDGSGSASDNTHDVVVTTKDQAKVGDVVVVKGVVRTDKDLGSGYAYKVLIEEATLQK